MRDSRAVQRTISDIPYRKSRKRPVGFGELQPAEAGRIDCGRGVGGSRMPGERQNRAVRKILLDFMAEGPVELPQYDPDSRVGVARQQCSVQIDLVVWR